MLDIYYESYIIKCLLKNHTMSNVYDKIIQCLPLVSAICLKS